MTKQEQSPLVPERKEPMDELIKRITDVIDKLENDLENQQEYDDGDGHVDVIGAPNFDAARETLREIFVGYFDHLRQEGKLSEEGFSIWKKKIKVEEEEN